MDVLEGLSLMGALNIPFEGINQQNQLIHLNTNLSKVLVKTRI